MKNDGIFNDICQMTKMTMQTLILKASLALLEHLSSLVSKLLLATLNRISEIFQSKISKREISRLYRNSYFLKLFLYK